MQMSLRQKEENTTGLNIFFKSEEKNKKFTDGSLLKMNWNRLSKLTQRRTTYNLTEDEQAELNYRLCLQNEYSNTGVLNRKEYILPVNHEQYLFLEGELRC